MNVAKIRIADTIFHGWKTVRIERGMEQLCGSFELGVTERWDEVSTPHPIRRGDRCEVLIDNEVVVTGWIDDVSPTFSADSHDFRIGGRDATGDLVDCAAIHKSGQWANAKLDIIARDICKPFGITVIVDTDIGTAFPTYSIQEGETAYECIERACRSKAVLPVSDGKGNLLLTRAKDGTAVSNLVQGENILSGQGQFSNRERHSLYIIKGQDKGSDDNLDTPETHTQVKAEATDSFITRYRPAIIMAEDHGAHATYKERAEWERNVRRGRANRAVILVQGWRDEKGKLWQPNTMVHLVSSWLGVAAGVDLLIVSVTFTLDDQTGTRAELHLADRQAFDLISGVKGTTLARAIKGKDGAGVSANDGKKKKSSSQDWGLTF